MAKSSYFLWMISNLGFEFKNNITLLKVRKDILYNLYKDNPNAIETLTNGLHPQYRRIKKEDWDIVTFNNTEVPVCTRKFASDRGTVRLIDRNVDELKREAERTFEVLKENNLIKT